MFLSSRFSSEKKKQSKDCRETLLHFHFHIHNSSVLCFIRAKLLLLSLYLYTFTFSRFQFPPSSKTGQIWRQHGVWTHLELLLPLSPERSLRRLLLDGDLLLIFWKYFIVSSAGWWFGFDFLKIFYCCCFCFCWMVIWFRFFRNILLFLLMDGDLLLIFFKNILLLLLLLLLDGDHIDGVICFTQISVLNRNLCRQEIASCDGKFLGHRYADPSDPSLVKKYM